MLDALDGQSLWRTSSDPYGGYSPGVDLHRLVFAGHAHNAEAWSSRVALPLQLLFPAEPHAPPERVIEHAIEELVPD